MSMDSLVGMTTQESKIDDITATFNRLLHRNASWL